VHLYSEQFIADMSIGCCHQIARQGMPIPGGAPGEGMIQVVRVVAEPSDVAVGAEPGKRR